MLSIKVWAVTPDVPVAHLAPSSTVATFSDFVESPPFLIRHNQLLRFIRMNNLLKYHRLTTQAYVA